MTRRKPIEWTEAHRREALRRTLELAALILGGEVGGPDPITDAHQLCANGTAAVRSEERWREVLGFVYGRARIHREVRRVDALATGRLVRETVRCVWRIVDTTDGCDVVIWEGDAPPNDNEVREPWARRRVTVRRIRRAP